MDKLYAALFSDVLDQLGLPHQVATGFLVNYAQASCFGPVRTLALEAGDYSRDQANIVTGLHLVEQMQSGEILVVQGCAEFAYFGELMSRLAESRSLGGVVIDGATRDSAYTATQPVPIFAQSYSPLDMQGRGRIVSADTPITLQGIAVSPGDWVFADTDGVVCLPKAKKEVICEEVRSVVEKEKAILEGLEQGKTVDDLIQEYDLF